MSVTQNIQRLRSQIPENVQLICVTKFHSDEIIMEAYHAGERHLERAGYRSFAQTRTPSARYTLALYRTFADE